MSAPTFLEGPGRVNLRIILALAAAAVIIRLAVFCLSVQTGMGLSLPSAENWQDFSLAYVPAVDALKSGFLPYADFYYPYPPLFLYALTAFSYLPLPSWSSALPLVISDALTVVPVYLLARELGGARTALIASAAFILSPVNIYYVGYLWLNPSLTTLFLMTSVYLLLKGRYSLSAVAFAVSFGFKQTALLALPVMALILWKRNSRRQGLRYFLWAALMCVLVSVPFVLISPVGYVYSLFGAPFSFWTPSVPPNYFTLGVGTGTAVSFNTLISLTSKWQLVATAINSPVSILLPVFIFLIPSSLAWSYPDFVYLSYLVLLVGYLFVLYRIRRTEGIENAGVLTYLLLAFLFFFTFYPLYKYYVVGLIPFLVLLLRNKKDAVSFAAFSFVFMLGPRYLGSWVLLVLLLWLVRSHLRWPLK